MRESEFTQAPICWLRSCESRSQSQRSFPDHSVRGANSVPESMFQPMLVCGLFANWLWANNRGDQRLPLSC